MLFAHTETSSRRPRKACLPDDGSRFSGLEAMERRLLLSVIYGDALQLMTLDDLNADPRFDQLNGAGRGIAIIDAELDLDHPAFGPDLNNDGRADRIKEYQNLIPMRAPTSAAINHGTGLTSIIASEDQNHPGIAPEADIYFFRASYYNTSDQFSTDWYAVETALQWVIDYGEAHWSAPPNLSHML